MSLRFFYLHFFLIFTFITSSLNIFSAQDDTVKVYLTNTIPLIDGDSTDLCWQHKDVKWQNINETWMPWGGVISSADFAGKYKAVWNSDSNCIYFLVQIIDDSFITGYTYPNKGYPDYDIVEIFIDENISKGPHIFDVTGTSPTNAENAFSLHIAPQITGSQPYRKADVLDIDGSSWSKMFYPNYREFIPHYALKTNSNQYTYEFALAIYDDTYEIKHASNPSTARTVEARVKLTKNKIIGFTMAYCDADDAVGRDHFFGSVKGESNKIETSGGQSIYNQAWQNADNYGRIILMDTLKNIQTPPLNTNTLFQNFNQMSISTHENHVKIDIKNHTNGTIFVEFTNSNGQVIYGNTLKTDRSQNSYFVPIPDQTHGLLIVKAVSGNEMQVKKLIK